MKKLLCLLTALLLFAAPALAEFDLSAMSPEELQALIAQAQTQLELSEDKLVTQAIDMIKDQLLASYYAPERYHSNDPRGYLEILNTRVIYINRDFATQGEYLYKTDEQFSNVYCVIEFVLLSDMVGSAPYYPIMNNLNSVFVYFDGSMKLPFSVSIFNAYLGRDYDDALGKIIKSVNNLGSAYNAVYYLLEE